MSNAESPHSNSKKLIISLGDISDVDAFYALAEYAKTGADVLFVMNYPAYVGVDPAEAQHDSEYEAKHPGLGFKYSGKQVLEKVPSPAPDEYAQFISRYDKISNDNSKIHSAMTDASHFLVNEIWKESLPEENKIRPGRLTFCIGGINAINPFSAKAIKYEPLFYCKFIPADCARLVPAADLAREGDLFDCDGKPTNIDFADYPDIYMDMNGPASAFSKGSLLDRQLSAAVARLRGVFVMGGVQAGEPARTMPAIAGTLNRFSAATMNQLYHPANAARLLALLADRGVACFTVSNNAVEDLTTFADAERRVKTYDGVERFLAANGIRSPLLLAMCREYYERLLPPPPRKAFDFHTALALARLLREGRPPPSAPRTLHYSAAYGVALVAADAAWPDARRRYAAGIDARPADGDSDFERGKKAAFARELRIMDTLDARVTRAHAARTVTPFTPNTQFPRNKGRRLAPPCRAPPFRAPPADPADRAAPPRGSRCRCGTCPSGATPPAG